MGGGKIHCVTHGKGRQLQVWFITFVDKRVGGS